MNHIKGFWLIPLLVFSACSNNSTNWRSIYLSPNGTADRVLTEWHIENLNALKEPAPLVDKREVFRFTWLRTFDNPVAVRIEPDRAQPKLTLKVTDGASGYDPGKLTTDKSFVLSDQDLVQLKSHLAFLKACKVLPRQPMMFDGASWIFEYKNGDAYCLRIQQSPKSGGWREAGLALLKLSGYQAGDRLY